VDVTDRGIDARTARPRPLPRPGSSVAIPELPRNGQLVANAGSAIVSAARVGRLLGRTGWRLARQLPGMAVVEQQAQRLREAAAAELLRLLEVPQQMFGTASPEEQRVMMLVRDADSDPAPLRTAMSELLHRSAEGNRKTSRENLFGTIVSQLVPDEARILAILAQRPFPAVDVVTKPVGRSSARTVLADTCTLGEAARVALPANTATYLRRLRGFGLAEDGPPLDGCDDEYERLAGDDAVRAARRQVDSGLLGSVRVVRKSVALSPLGKEFWAACAPGR
jgi:hypothetical protein